MMQRLGTLKHGDIEPEPENISCELSQAQCHPGCAGCSCCCSQTHIAAWFSPNLSAVSACIQGGTRGAHTGERCAEKPNKSQKQREHFPDRHLPAKKGLLPGSA